MDEGIMGDARRAAEERVCEAVRVLSLAIDRYVTEVSRVLGVPARDVHAMGVVKGVAGRLDRSSRARSARGLRAGDDRARHAG